MLLKLKLTRLPIINRSSFRPLSTSLQRKDTIQINNNNYPSDAWTNVTPKMLSYLGRNIHLQKDHPLSIIRQRIVKYFYKTYQNSRGNPLFAVFDNISPIVSVQQNFDSLLIAKDHPSRAKSDCYYINEQQLLRAHTTAHQLDLVKSGLDNFLVVGEVYRRDEIDSTHYPVFHQVDAVRLMKSTELFKDDPNLQIFESSYKTLPHSFQATTSKCLDHLKQPCHTLEAVKLTEQELKNVLLGLARDLFGPDIEYRWVDTFFPFTKPSWELEIFYNGKWLEVLGSGIMRHEILQSAGVENSIGYAFGLGLERLAMVLFDIPDIRLFWSKDSGFLSQFSEADLTQLAKYRAVSSFPQCANDLSFWLADGVALEEFSANDFYDLARDCGGDVIEQITLKDKFTHPKTKKSSLCFHIVYRHMEKTLTQTEVNQIHNKIASEAMRKFNVVIR